MFKRLHVYIDIYIERERDTYTYLYTYTYICVHTCIHMCMYIHMDVLHYLSLLVCIYTYICVYIYTHTNIRVSSPGPPSTACKISEGFSTVPCWAQRVSASLGGRKAPIVVLTEVGDLGPLCLSAASWESPKIRGP